MLAFVLDENMRQRLASAIESYNSGRVDSIDFVQVGDTNGLPLATPDSEILRWAERENRILVSFDRGTLPIDQAESATGVAMPPANTSSAGLAAHAIGKCLQAQAYNLYLGPEGDYLRLKGHAAPHTDISVSSCGLPEGRYSVQICLRGDPLDIIYDDECDLPELLRICECYKDSGESG